MNLMNTHMFFLHASERSQQVWQFWEEAVMLLIFLSGWISVLLCVGWVSQPCYHFCVCPDSELLLSEGESRHKPPSSTLLNVSQPSFNWPTRAWQQPLSLTPLKPPQNTLLFSPLLFLSLFLLPSIRRHSRGANVSHLIAQEFHY